MKMPPRNLKWSNRLGQQSSHDDNVPSNVQECCPRPTWMAVMWACFILINPSIRGPGSAWKRSKRQQPENTSISTDEGVSPFTSDDFASRARTKVATVTSPVPVRWGGNPRSVKNMKGKLQVPKEPKKVQNKADKTLTDAVDIVPDTIH